MHSTMFGNSCVLMGYWWDCVFYTCTFYDTTQTSATSCPACYRQPRSRASKANEVQRIWTKNTTLPGRDGARVAFPGEGVTTMLGAATMVVVVEKVSSASYDANLPRPARQSSMSQRRLGTQYGTSNTVKTLCTQQHSHNMVHPTQSWLCAHNSNTHTTWYVQHSQDFVHTTTTLTQHGTSNTVKTLCTQQQHSHNMVHPTQTAWAVCRGRG
jgi:hypothetical protein